MQDRGQSELCALSPRRLSGCRATGELSRRECVIVKNRIKSHTASGIKQNLGDILYVCQRLERIQPLLDDDPQGTPLVLVFSVNLALSNSLATFSLVESYSKATSRASRTQGRRLMAHLSTIALFTLVITWSTRHGWCSAVYKTRKNEIGRVSLSPWKLVSVTLSFCACISRSNLLTPTTSGDWLTRLSRIRGAK